MTNPIRNLVVVLGDQLDKGSSAFTGFDPSQDAVWMAEVSSEATQVWSHKARIAIFLSSMRHFRDELRQQKFMVHYRELTNSTLGSEIAHSIYDLRPKKVIVVEPGEWRVQEELKKAVPGLIIQPDHHFLCSKEDFATHVEDRKQLRLEFFYREMRRRYKILMEDERPAGGAWNFDAENRGNFAKSGPGPLPAPVSFAQDSVTQEVIGLVEKIFPGHPGSLKNFNWPVTRSQALKGLEDFIFHRLPNFGRYQDAMWTGEPWLYHSRLSTALNLKLLQPAEVIGTAEKAYQQQQASLAAVEGFIRQILGWREYVRGIYWYFMPDYLRRNSLNAKMELPKFYWTGETEMNCLREVITQTLNYGYAHHIQRLMVTGLYALLLGVKPVEVHKWYLAIYVDAVEWVEAPNVLGMSQFADGGLMASKPYIATGKYIQRMSNYCAICRYKPEQTTGPAACPFTTLYWDFLMRHENILQKNQRMLLQLNNLRRFTQSEKQSIKEQADQIRASQLS